MLEVSPGQGWMPLIFPKALEVWLSPGRQAAGHLDGVTQTKLPSPGVICVLEQPSLNRI